MFNLPDIKSLFQACISNDLLTLLRLSIGPFDSNTIKNMYCTMEKDIVVICLLSEHSF